MQAQAPFVCTVGGVALVVRVGDVYPAGDPAVTASPHSFRPIKVMSSRDQLGPINRVPGVVEVATAAPGERRTLTTPPVAAPVSTPPATDRPTAAAKAAAAKKTPAAAGAPSEV